MGRAGRAVRDTELALVATAAADYLKAWLRGDVAAARAMLDLLRAEADAAALQPGDRHRAVAAAARATADELRRLGWPGAAGELVELAEALEAAET